MAMGYIVFVKFFLCLSPLVLLLIKTLDYLAVQSIDFERTWWKLFQKMFTKFDIYAFIITTGTIPLLVDYQSSSVSSALYSVLRQWHGLLDIIWYWHLQFQNNIIINKTKLLLPRAWITLVDFGYPVQAFWLYCFH